MMMNRQLEITTPNDRDLVISREFDAPPQLLFDAWTKPELLKRWFGPPGWELPECEVDLRVGGRWRYLMRSSETGEEMGIHGVYQEIVVPELMVTTEQFDQPWYEGDCLDRLEFIAQGDRTLLKLTTTYDSKEIRDGVVSTGMAEGMNASYARLDEVLIELA